METLCWVSNGGVYDYDGPLMLACSSGGKVAANDQALQDANLAANTNFLNNAKTAFGEQQAVQAKQTALANNMMANPMGYTPRELAIQTTGVNENFARSARQALGSAAAFANNLIANPLGYTAPQLANANTAINENFANAAKGALGSAAAFAAAHGSSDIGGGATGQIAGQIGGQAATGAAAARASLSQQNEALKRESMLTGLQELNTAGTGAQGAVGGSVSGAGTTGETTTNAGTGVTAAQQAGWGDVTGVLSGISGLATAGLSPFKASKTI